MDGAGCSARNSYTWPPGPAKVHIQLECADGTLNTVSSPAGALPELHWSIVEFGCKASYLGQGLGDVSCQ